MEDRRKSHSRTERVAEHPYVKLSTPIVIAASAALVIFFLKDIHADFKVGQHQINNNVTDIAINKDGIADNFRDIQRVQQVNQRQWQMINDR